MLSRILFTIMLSSFSLSCLASAPAEPGANGSKASASNVCRPNLKEVTMYEGESPEGKWVGYLQGHGSCTRWIDGQLSGGMYGQDEYSRPFGLCESLYGKDKSKYLSQGEAYCYFLRLQQQYRKQNLPKPNNDAKKQE